MKADYDIERAKLDVGKGETVSRLDNEQAKLAVNDAQQKKRELQEKVKSDQTSASRRHFGKQRKREKALFDLKRAEQGLRRPAAAGAGRRHGQPAAELPIRQACSAASRIFSRAIAPGRARRSWSCRISRRCTWRRVSTKPIAAACSHSRRPRCGSRRSRARISRGGSIASRFSPASTSRPAWPPSKNFDLNLVFIDVDPRMRPGMTAVARIATERVPDVVLVPVESIFQRNGAPVVYSSEWLDVCGDAGHDPKARQVSRRSSNGGSRPAIGLRPAVRPRA